MDTVEDKIAEEQMPKRQPPGIELPIGLLLWAIILFLFPKLVAVGFFSAWRSAKCGEVNFCSASS